MKKLKGTLITKEFLKREGACVSSLRLFSRCFPNGCKLNKTNLKKWINFCLSQHRISLGTYNLWNPPQACGYTISQLGVFLQHGFSLSDKLRRQGWEHMLPSTFNKNKSPKIYFEKVVKILGL